MCDTADGARVPRSAPPVFYRLSTAQIPNAMVAMAPPKLKSRMGPSPPSSVVPTTSPTCLAYRRRGPEHCGHRKPLPCSWKNMPAHSFWQRRHQSECGEEKQRERWTVTHGRCSHDVPGYKCSRSPCTPSRPPSTAPPSRPPPLSILYVQGNLKGIFAHKRRHK